MMSKGTEGVTLGEYDGPEEPKHRTHVVECLRAKMTIAQQTHGAAITYTLFGSKVPREDYLAYLETLKVDTIFNGITTFHEEV
jgi:hypothetical protein